MSDRPRTRFDAIAEEMLEEPRMTVPEEANVVVDEKAFVCPACCLGAFEHLTRAFNKVMMACLGCPTNPVYELDRDAEVKTNRYRCGRCGNEPLVTMTLSEVNLYCRRCAQLTLHTRQADPVRSTRGATKNYDLLDAPRELSYSSATGWKIVRPRLTEAARARLDAVVAGVIANEARSTPVGRIRRSMSVDAMVEAMRVTLGLDDFEEFRAKARKRNADLAVLSGEDLDLKRGSGRTTRGILRALAACFAQEVEVLWVCGHRPLYDDDLRRLCADLRDRLRLAHPVEVRRMPSDLSIISIIRWSPGGHHVYVDHSFYESRNERRLDVGTLNGIVDAQERP
jgi:hypothetical protein